ncbi:MAG: hypothetical protein M1818_001220 [Claussenomyces sp. TS43310]|nr:MAG: hypothetical protein M1818_001220 [Claussenomyces sp. TS43310]
MEREPYNDWSNDAGFNAEVEQHEPVELKVIGTIPAFAAGTLYRNGPGHYKIRDTKAGEFSLSHWFDGLSHIYRFQIVAVPDGSCKVIFNSRGQVDGLIDRIRKTGNVYGVSFGQKRDPCMSLFQKIKCVFQSAPAGIPDTHNVGVTIHENVPGLDGVPSVLSEKQSDSSFHNLTAFTDSANLKKLDPDTLEPSGVTDQKILHPALSGPLSCAHAQYDPIDGDMFNYNLTLGKQATYRIFRTSTTTGNTEILATISNKDIKAAYIHSFFLTPSCVVLGVWPSHYALGGVSILWTRNMLDAISAFDATAKTKWLVIDRKHGRGHIATFESSAFFAFHSVNAWEEERENSKAIDIFCDVVQYPNLDILHRFYYENLVSTGPGVHAWTTDGARREGVAPSLVRYRLGGISAGAVSPENSVCHINASTEPAEITLQIQAPLIGELPTTNPKFSTRKTRYVYSAVDRGHSSFFDGICKTDLESRTAITWAREHHTPGEPIFVPRPAGLEEDDGVVLSVVLDGDLGTSYLLCLDAKTMTELGRAEAGRAVGFGFHGRHVASPAAV